MKNYFYEYVITDDDERSNGVSICSEEASDGHGRVEPGPAPSSQHGRPRFSSGGGADWWRPGATAGSHNRDQEGIPTWDGSASRWRRYKKDVALWVEGVNLDVNWSWAARMVRNRTRPDKTLGESIPMVELRSKPRTWIS